MDLLPQDLLQCSSFSQLIDQFVQIADLLHQRVLDLFHADAADHACDQGTIRIKGWRLRKEGFQISTAFDGIEGLEKAVREKPNLIILDIEMPGMDGYEVCKRLQHYAPTAKIPPINTKKRPNNQKQPGRS